MQRIPTTTADEHEPKSINLPIIRNLRNQKFLITNVLLSTQKYLSNAIKIHINNKNFHISQQP